jgi:hypothetical protein
MKVAYIYYLVTKDQLGVENKILQQGRAISAAGLTDLDILILNPARQEKIGNVQFIKFRASPLPLNYYDYLFRRYALIDHTVDLSRYDYLILRYPLADKTGIQFCQKHRVISEHNTNEPAELRSRLKLKASPPDKVARRLLLSQEDKYAEPVLRNCLGVIAATDEIQHYERGRAKTDLPGRTIANGVTVDDIPFTGFKRFDGKQLDVLFVASFLRPWHGLDRVIQSFNHYQGQLRWTIHIVGNIDPETVRPVSPGLENLKFYGPKRGAELTAIISDMHLAVSSMTEYRINLNEACPLKTRDYTSRGMPFILAYLDPDLLAVDEQMRFYLEFKNDDSLLDIDEVIDFAADMAQRQEEVSTYMRQYALAHMDWRIKLQEYLEFVEQISRKQV